MLYGIKQLFLEYAFTAVSGEEQNELAGTGRKTELIWIFCLRICNRKSKMFQSTARDSITS